jgi:hypothetical protein
VASLHRWALAVLMAIGGASIAVWSPVSVLAGPPPIRPGPDVLGLYTATDETGRSNITIASGQFDLYLCLTGCTVPEGVYGWEVRIAFPATGLLVDPPTLYGFAVDVGTPPDHVVGLATPLPLCDCIVLARWRPTVLATDPQYVHFSPATFPSIPGAIAFAGGDDPADLRPLRPSSGDLGLAVFGINTGPLPGFPPATATRTWSAVKAMFR